MTSEKRLCAYPTWGGLVFLFVHGFGKMASFILGLATFLTLFNGGGIWSFVEFIILAVQFHLLSQVSADFRAGEKPISELLLRVTFISIGMTFVALGGCFFLFWFPK
ncbi:MAG: hypothetical protein WAO71_00895 [Gallionella sp.]